MTRKTRLTYDDLWVRFNVAGGAVHHFRGRRSLYVSTVKQGRFRYQDSRQFGLCPTSLTNNIIETATLREWRCMNRCLLGTAKALPPVTPTIAAVGTLLDAVEARTLPPEEIDDMVNSWLYIVEWTRTSESDAAFLLQGHQKSRDEMVAQWLCANKEER